jgi:hypothetical protein
MVKQEDIEVKCSQPKKNFQKNSHDNLPVARELMSKSVIYLEAFTKRCSDIYSFYVDTDLFHKALSLGPISNSVASLLKLNGCPSQDLSKKRANYAATIAAVAIGALIEKNFDRSYYQECNYIFISSFQAIPAEEIGHEVLFASAIISLFHQKTNNFIEFNHYCDFFFTSLQTQKCPINERLRYCKAYLCNVRSSQDVKVFHQIKSCLWRKISSMMNYLASHFKRPFPMMLQAIRDLEQNSPLCSLEEETNMSIFSSQSVNALLLCVSIPSFAWARNAVLFTSENSEVQKIQILEEVIRFHFLLLKSSKTDFKDVASEAKTCIELTQVVFQLLAGERAKAKKLLIKICCRMDLDNFLLLSFLTNPQLLQQMHFLAMALSCLEMTNEYNLLQKQINTCAAVFFTPNFSPAPPLKPKDVCEDSNCMKLWELLATTDIPQYVLQGCLEQFSQLTNFCYAENW